MTASAIKNFCEVRIPPYPPKEASTESRCPNCGYCPHCGRSNGWTNRQPYRVPDYVPYWLWDVTSTGTALNTWYSSMDAQNSVGEAPASLGQTPIAFVTGLSPANSN